MAVTAAPQAEVHTTIGERAHMLMWRQKLNQTQVGRQIGVDQAALSKKLRGERPWYAHEVLGISTVLGTTIDYLYGLTDEPTDPDPSEPGSDVECAPWDLNPEPADMAPRRLAPAA